MEQISTRRFFRSSLYKIKKKKYYMSNFLSREKNVYCFKSKEFTLFTQRQKEQYILFLKWFLRRAQKKTLLKGSFHFYIFPFKYNTKKPLGIRMGKGKGPIDKKFACIFPGLTFLIIKNVHPFFFNKLKKFLIARFGFQFRVFTL